MRKLLNLLAVLIISLLAVAMVSAVDSTGLEVVSVKINDQEVDWVNSILIEEEEPVKVRIGLKGLTDLEDLEVEAKISGYEHGSAVDSVEELDITQDTTKYVTLVLELPEDMTEQEEQYLLRLRVLDKNSIISDETVTLQDVDSLEGASGSGSSGGAVNPEEAVPLQITIISPENESIVTEEMFSDIIVYEVDFWLVKSGDNQLEIDEPIGPSSQGVVDFIDDDDLSVLADDIFVVNGGKYKYEQFLHFDNPAIKVTSDENNNMFLKVAGNQLFARYEINFLTAPKSVITDSEENPTLNGEYLPDFLLNQLSQI